LFTARALREKGKDACFVEAYVRAELNLPRSLLKNLPPGLVGINCVFICIPI